jgi:hypothetical protein
MYQTPSEHSTTPLLNVPWNSCTFKFLLSLSILTPFLKVESLLSTSDECLTFAEYNAKTGAGEDTLMEIQMGRERDAWESCAGWCD